MVDDVRKEETKDDEGASNGGDFHGPFWADAKDHVAGLSDLRMQTKLRIESNKARSRLYPLLTESFLSLWNEKVRWRNEKFEAYPTSVKAQFTVEELNATIKIENLVAVRIPDGSSRVIYPYFSETPILPDEGARLGFWALQQALPDFRYEDFRIIDLLRRAYFRPAEVGRAGDEPDLFIAKYRQILDEWARIRGER
ncbi:hypothetical protein [Bradyrhizobium guangdongense]|uniref:Uncharacterized protein n=1 Tax=Bradyrhizobium guangdongense TaxID=1325090 RepID=A0AA88BAL7_9BRAD|nr:hypothetical protein [Bradyrhizobium guangdongense]GGI33077.1 hypothetical protein GCM10010987_72590 [Bradyrhizobium guangdongense]